MASTEQDLQAEVPAMASTELDRQAEVAAMASTEQDLQAKVAAMSGTELDLQAEVAAVSSTVDRKPTKLIPYWAGSVGVLLLCVYLTAGSKSGDGPSKYNVDISGIVANKIRLPDGRHIAYEERGVSRDVAKRNILVLHGFLSCRLGGIPGVSDRLLEKYAARVVAFDRPGIGQSDPHPEQTFNTVAQDMADIADALGMGEKFWVLGYSGGGPFTWGALRYIPHRLAGVAMFAPMGNPYAKNFTEVESTTIWREMNGARRVMFRLAHYLPSLLPAYMQAGLMGKPVTIIKIVTQDASPKDVALLETDHFGWGLERSMKESMRSGDAKPHAQGVILHCQDWGFELADLRPTKDSSVFSGPIHIFHGTEDSLVPLIMSQYAKRMIPELHLHVLDGHGHFSWFCYCDSCHREFFETLFGEVEDLELEQTPSDVAPTTPAPKEVTEMQARVSSEADANALEDRNLVIRDDEVQPPSKRTIVTAD